MKHDHKGIMSVYLKGQAKFATKSELEYAVGNLLWESGIKILRIKGAICLADSPHIYELQGYVSVYEELKTFSR